MRISATTACSWALTARAFPAMALSAAAIPAPPSCGMRMEATKLYAFHMAAKAPSDTLHVFESAIDLLSYITLAMESGQPWQRASYLSLSGVYAPARDNPALPMALEQYLSTHAQVRNLVLCLDNDRGGHMAAAAIRERLPPDFYVEARFPAGKDYNAQLMEQKGLGGIRAREPKTAGHGSWQDRASLGKPLPRLVSGQRPALS